MGGCWKPVELFLEFLRAAINILGFGPLSLLEPEAVWSSGAWFSSGLFWSSSPSCIAAKACGGGLYAWGCWWVAVSQLDVHVAVKPGAGL